MAFFRGLLVWRLDRWGRSLTDLLATLQEPEHLGVEFVSLTEALDLTGRRGAPRPDYWRFSRNSNGKSCGNEPALVWRMRGRKGNDWLGRQPQQYILRKSGKLHGAGVSKSEIARRLKIGRTSVRRVLGGPIFNEK